MEKIGWTDCARNEAVTPSQEGKLYPTNNKRKGRLTEYVTSCVETAF